MNWKARQRHLAEMRWKARGHRDICIPPLPKVKLPPGIPAVKVVQVINPKKPKNKNPFVDLFPIPFRKETKRGPCPDGYIDVCGRYGEVTRVPKHPLKNPWSYIDWLEKKGFKRLGAGAYSTVLGKDGSDKVIKVSRSLDNWIDYIQWAAKEGYAGNLAPKVFSWKKHESDTNNFSVAIVERMQSTTRDDNYKSDASVIMSLTYPARKGNIMAQLFMEELQANSVKFFNQLHELDFDGDIGGGNVMVRANGTICVTDPTAGNIKTTVKRLRSGDFSPAPLWISIENSYRHRSEWFTQSYQDLVDCL